jgi:RNA polymerase sigma factor (sigma-70 family)
MSKGIIGKDVEFRYTLQHLPAQFSLPASGSLVASDTEIGVFLTRLRSEEAENAWQWFLSSYAGPIYATIKLFSRDSDDQGDCFLFICEKLVDKRYRRLLAFKPDGRARFSTWLRAVVRNLCLDWLRSRYGRKQTFRSIASEGQLEREIFRYVFQHRLGLEQAWLELQASGVSLSFDEFEEHAVRIQNLLTSRQLWLLSTANTKLSSIDEDAEGNTPIDVPDSALGPEDTLLLADIHESVSKTVETLEEADRLLIRLRYAQELGLAEIAGLLGLKDAQTADRRIREALERLRQHLGISGARAGKRKTISV